MNKILKQNYIAKEDIIIEPNDILKQVSQKVELPLTKDDFKLLKILYKHVSDSQDQEYAEKYEIRSAVGIAAVQVGFLKRLIAIKTVDENDKIHKYMLANPEIVYKSEEMCYLSNGEGCLSVEEGKYKGIVPRHRYIKIVAYNLFTKNVEIFTTNDFRSQFSFTNCLPSNCCGITTHCHTEARHHRRCQRQPRTSFNRQSVGIGWLHLA